MSNKNNQRSNVKITDKTYNPISVIVKGTANAILGTNFKYGRTYDYEENGKTKSEYVHSFSEFKEKKKL
jgi:hypothetical protein